jgi:hypothetical protein
MALPSTQAVHGGCYCGNLRLEIELTQELARYQPRACDCGFCTKHGAAYLSDPQGTLRIRIADPTSITRYRQGSELAEMLLCSQCGVLVGAVYRAGERIYATVNVRAIEGTARWPSTERSEVGSEGREARLATYPFGSPQSVSPRLLSGDDKVARWQSLWFADVEIG